VDKKGFKKKQEKGKQLKPCVFVLTQHPHQYFIDPRENSDDVKGRERDMKKKSHSDLDSFFLTSVSETKNNLG
jgi:hypothetical protein